MSEPTAEEIEAAARALYAEERNDSMGFDEWPDYDDADNLARPIFEEHALAALTAAYAVPDKGVADETLEKWRAASDAARRSEHHFPADCLAEAIATVKLLRDRHDSLAEEIAQAIERGADRSGAWTGPVIESGPRQAALLEAAHIVRTYTTEETR